MSVPPVRVSYSVPPPNLNVPPPNLNEPPPNMNMPLPNLNVPPPKLFVPPPNFKVPQPVPICTPPPYGSMSPPALPPMTIPPPIRPYPVAPIYKRSVPRPFNAAPNNYPNVNHTRPSTSKDFQDPFSSHSGRNGRSGRDSIDRLSRSCTSKRIQSPSHENKYETDVESERDKRYQEHRYSRSYNMRSRSLSNMSHRGRENSYRPRFDERRDYEQNRCEYERHSMSQIRDHGSHSRAESRESRRPLRTPRRMSKRSPTRDRLLSRTREWSHVSRHESLPKRKTEREKILEEYRLNYCKTSEVFIQKMEQWSKEHKSDEEETSNKWYRSSPAELYYKQVENGSGVQQTSKLEMICDVFLKELIERGRKARPEVDELPPLKPTKVSLGKDTEEVSTSSESDDECLEEEALEGYTDKIMQELQRKQSHPRRLHPEMYFNTTGENNGGRQCRCNASARSQGIQHGVYANEEAFPKCVPAQSNVDKLYHYRITVSPPTNFLINIPTLISHDEHEYLFTGFSMFSHYKLGKLPACNTVWFNIEYTIFYVEEPAPQNFTIKELDLFEEFLFYELLELVDLDLGKGTDTTCSQFHFMPRFERYLPGGGGGCEVLAMCEVMKYLIAESGLLTAPDKLEAVHNMDHYTWQKFVNTVKNMIVTFPGKKPCSVRLDQLDRTPPSPIYDSAIYSKNSKTFYPEIVHFGLRPPQLSYAGNPEYQEAWRVYVKYRHYVANMAKPSFKERQKLTAKEARLREIRAQINMKKQCVTVVLSSQGCHKTGLMCDVVQHAMLIPVLVKHLRFHKSLDSLEKKIGYVFKDRALLQTALTHPSYKENYGTNPDHSRNSLSNCGIRQPEYGEKKIHYNRKKGIVPLMDTMSRFGEKSEMVSNLKHNERLEFLGDAVVEFVTTTHLFSMFPGTPEGGLSTYRNALVQNEHLAVIAKKIELEKYMLYTHSTEMCRETVMRHAMANCFEALMGSLFLDAGIEVADRVFALILWYNEPDMLETWEKERPHPLQVQEPLGDRKYIKDFEFLQKLVLFENAIGVEFKHIRLLARAFTDRSVGFTHLTLGCNQRLEFLGDAVLKLVVSDRLYRHFPEHQEGHLSILRSALVNNRTQSMVCDDLGMSRFAAYNCKVKPANIKHKADLVEAFLGALFIDKNLMYCQTFCNVTLIPRLQDFIMNQDWHDPKSKLQQCCLALRSKDGREPDVPAYKVIERLGPQSARTYIVAVYFRGKRLAEARGRSVHEAEMNAAEKALICSHELFSQLDYQKRVIVESLRRKTKRGDRRSPLDPIALRQSKDFEDKVPKAYRLDNQHENAEESCHVASDEEVIVEKPLEDSGLDGNSLTPNEKLDNVQVSSLLCDMQRIKADLIKNNEYEKLLQKSKQSDSDDD